MAYTYPTTPSFRDMVIRMNDPSITFRAQNGRRISRKVSGHLWSGTLTYPPMTKASFVPIRGFLAKLRGQYNTFTIIPPNLANPLGTQIADTTVATGQAVGAITVPISGATSGNTFKAGDVLKFSNHDKVYMLTDDATASGGGTATLSFMPPLVTAITTSHTVKHKNVPFTMALTNSLQEMQTSVTDLYTFELECEEVF